MADNAELFQLVVVGSSAGGIEALSKLVASLPDIFRIPIVIAQHLDPTRLSHLGEILARHTTLRVVSVQQQELLKAGTIYVVPSNHHVEITDHDVSLLPDGDGRPTPSINLLLTSAAEIYNEKLIAVILTGTGSDGTEGAQIVHQRGGTVIIQNPETAAYPGMPNSVEPETVDFVSDLPKIGSILVGLINGDLLKSASIVTKLDISSLLPQIREYTGIDFSSYKLATLLRRVQRRFLATGASDVASYGLYLKANPNEYDLLVADFLIKVTEFMRDPDLFSYLQKQIVPKLIEFSLLHNKELRFWCAGCATGEEAYSLAILISEALGQELAQFSIKIFATDLDTNAITFARRGFYTSKSLEKLPSELVEKYFMANLNGTGYEVKKQVRNLVIFGEHDLGQRAPFPRIDMVLCRNVLIYFNRKMQEHALQLFAFALRDEGYLVLGRTETVSPLAEFFNVIEPQQRVYLRQGVRRLIPPLSLRNVIPTATHKAPNDKSLLPRVLERGLFQAQQEAHQNRLTRDNLLLKLPVGIVVVDSHFDILEINAAARRMLSIHTLGVGEDFVHLAQNIPPRVLAAAISRTIRENIVSTMEPLEVPHVTTGETTFLQIICYPQPWVNTVELQYGVTSKNDEQHVLIIIADITREVMAQRKLKQDNIQQANLVEELNQHIQNLKHNSFELQKSNTLLVKANEELAEAKNIEFNPLKLELEQVKIELASIKNQQREVAMLHARQMEELVEANRNLLAANEEVTTQNAILRTENEEYLLHSEETQAAIEEVDTLNEEMQATNEELETLNEELQATVEELNTTNSDLVVQGEALVKLSGELQTQHQLSEREKAQLEAILESMPDALVVVDSDNKVLLSNNAYEALLQATIGAVLADELGKIMTLVQAVGDHTSNQILNFRNAEGNRHWLESTSQTVRGKGMDDWQVVVLRDITERSLRNLQEQFFSIINHELRTPITVIKGYMQRLLSWLNNQEGDFEKPNHYLALALSQMVTLQRLIDDVMDVTRLQNGKFNINLQPVRLYTLLAKVVEVAQMLTKKQLEVEPATEVEPLWVKADTMRLEQAILNLITNAITHAPTSSKISLNLRKVEKHNMAEIRVQDYGAGIKAEYLGDVFNRFYQVTHGLPSTSTGLGLGLFICQQIVLAHGGTISVESIEGEGATFIVLLPLIEPAE